MLFEGTRGRLLCRYQTHQLLMAPGQVAGIPRKSIPNSIGHHREWIEACKSHGPTTCNFDYSGALTETVLLGNVSYRLGGKKLQWDPVSLRCPNAPEADQFLEAQYRRCWSLEG